MRQEPPDLLLLLIKPIKYAVRNPAVAGRRHQSDEAIGIDSEPVELGANKVGTLIHARRQSGGEKWSDKQEAPG